MPIHIHDNPSSPQVKDILVPLARRSAIRTAESCKEMRQRLRNPKGNTACGMRHLARIPLEVWNQNSEFFDDDDFLRRWLRENTAFLVGKL